jgi:hypothetical protein
MSVVKTAAYMKWQSAQKTQGLIFLSWIISGGIFGEFCLFDLSSISIVIFKCSEFNILIISNHSGVMIYLWPYFNQEAAE